MIKDLLFTLEVIGLILAILIGALFILAIIETIIDNFRKRAAAKHFYKEVFPKIEEEIYKSVKEESEKENKPKKTRKKTTKKDSN